MTGNKSHNNYTNSTPIMIKYIEMPSNVESIGLVISALNLKKDHGNYTKMSDY